MKKFLSFMLVLAMIASMMCINVAAAPEHVVGTHGQNNSIEDGATNLTAETSDPALIQATIDGVVYARYAVDLEYTIDSITIHNNAEWDVNDLKYVGDMTYTLNSGAAQTFVNNTPVYVGRFTVINYSNASVSVSATATNNSTVDITTNVYKVDSLTNLQKSTLVGTTTGNGVADSIGAVATAHGENDSGDAVPAYYIAEIVSSDWVGELWSVTGDNSNQQITIATITFAVSAQNNQNEPAQRPVQNPTQGN